MVTKKEESSDEVLEKDGFTYVYASRAAVDHYKDMDFVPVEGKAPDGLRHRGDSVLMMIPNNKRAKLVEDATFGYRTTKKMIEDQQNPAGDSEDPGIKTFFSKKVNTEGLAPTPDGG